MNSPNRPPFREHPGPAEITYHLARGRQLRARFIAGQVKRIGGAVSARVRRRERTPSAHQGENAAVSDVTLRMRDPLTAIRSSAEILRDNPGMGPAERARFVKILLREEQRLEGLLAALAPGTRRMAGQ